MNNRNIKFRAWNKTAKTMVDLQAITPLALDDMMNTQLAAKGGSGLFIPFLEEIELMQFTGLLDKNGKEIYEGDILECTSELIEWGTGAKTGKMQTTRAEVVWVGDHSCFAKKRLSDGHVEAGLGMNQDHIGKYYEVVGNIYEDSK